MSDSPDETAKPDAPALRRFFDFRLFGREKRIRLLLNLLVGILTVFILGKITQSRWGEGNLNLALDFFIQSEAEGEAAKAAPSDKIAYVDIDYDTYRGWGEPLLTPKNHLAEIIRGAARGKAKVIVLDILLEHPDREPGHDEALRQAVVEAASAGLKLIFPVRIGVKGDRKRNVLDDLIDADPGHLFRGVPYLSATPDDRIVRHWRLSSRFFPMNATQPAILWGTPFLGAVLACGREGSLGALEDFLSRRGPATANNHLFNFELGTGTNLLLSRKSTDFFLQRIRFSMIPRGVIPRFPEGNVQGLSVKEVEELCTDPDIAASFFQDRLVVVGNSSPDCGDIHPTPLGAMPGMFVMGNSINTILSGIQPSPSSDLVDILVELAAVVLGAFLFVHMPSVLAQLLASVVLLIVFGGFSFWYFLNHGVFFNFVFGIMGMEVLALLSDLEEFAIGRFMKKTSER